MSAAPWPTDLVFDREAKALRASFDDGAKFDIPFELLRVESPSAENKGHGGEAPAPVKGKANVGVVRAESVGRYAVRIVFDDGHDTGLFSWTYLHELGREQASRWADYERRLAAARLSRDA
jgi:DUF971 family protein